MNSSSAVLSLVAKMETFWPHIKLVMLLTLAAVVINRLEATGALCIVIGTTLTWYQAALQRQTEPSPPSSTSAAALEVASAAAATAAAGATSGTTPDTDRAHPAPVEIAASVPSSSPTASAGESNSQDDQDREVWLLFICIAVQYRFCVL